MSRLKIVLPVIAGAVAGAIVALIIAGTGGTKTVTTEIIGTGKAIPTAYGGKDSGININAIYRADINGVVDIDVITQTTTSNGLFSEPEKEEDEGAGVVYDDKGDIITDEHVIAGATSVTVHFEDGYTAKAKVLGSDASTDVGVIKVNVPASQLHPIAFADSSKAEVGDPVVAIGSPFSLPGTVTAGIVSAVGRDITAPNDYTIPGAIQTDAAINPGNSGGPLLNASGEVIGLNDQIETDNTTATGEGSSSGVGFATPGNTDVQIANEIISGKTVEHAYVGVCLGSASTGGAKITTGCSVGTGAVAADSPAAKAGLEQGDVITAVNGKKITSASDFISVISNYKPGQTVTLTVKMISGKTQKVKVTLANRPKTSSNEG